MKNKLQIINDSLIIYNNYKFRKNVKSGYYMGCVKGKRLRLHRYIYLQEIGPIPDEYQVHHIDFNKDNNDISNLILMHRSEHSRLHANINVQNNYEKIKENLEKIRPKATAWHSSEEGKAWHKEHFEASNLQAVKIFKCLNCGKEYEAIDNGHNMFCNKNCGQKYNRKQGKYNITKVCPICGKEYTTNKYRPASTCSRACNSMLKNKTK